MYVRLRPELETLKSSLLGDVKRKYDAYQERRKESGKQLSYHDFNHSRNVTNAAVYLAQKEGVSEEDMRVLIAAAAIHDMGFMVRYDKNEPIGAQIAEKWLSKSKYGFSKPEISLVKELIQATDLYVNAKKGGFEPPDKRLGVLGKIIRDADVASVSFKKFDWLKSILALRKEREAYGYPTKINHFLEQQIKFMNDYHAYYTKTAQREFNPVKRENLDKLKEYLAVRRLEFPYEFAEGRKRKSVGGYAIEKWLGSGAWGDTFLARRPGTGKDVVVKLSKSMKELQDGGQLSKKFPDNLRDYDNFTRRLLDEARFSQGAAETQGIVKVLDYGVLNSRPFIVMEHLKGDTLNNVLRRKAKQLFDANGNARLNNALEVMTQLTRAITAFHSREIMHSDLKPGNVMVEFDNAGKVKKTTLFDFGVSKFLQLGGREKEAYTVEGTPSYMSPEAWHKLLGLSKTEMDLPFGKFFDSKNVELGLPSDLYSLGVIFYELFAGQKPYEPNVSLSWKENIKDLGKQVIDPKKNPMKLNEMLRAQNKNPVPQELEDVIHTLLKKNPNERFKNAGELLEKLTKIRSKLSLTQKI